MTTIKLSERFGTDISSRRSASMLRRELVVLVSGGEELAEVDFRQVESVSDSFLDELFGIIVRDFGKQWFREHVRLVNITSDDRASLLSIIAQRLQESGPLTTNQLELQHTA